MDDDKSKIVVEPKKTIKLPSVDNVVYKVEQCIDYQNLYALEEDFNAIGLTVQTTPNRRMILCKLVDSKPVANKIIEDFIFVGSLDTAMNEISDRGALKICDFIRTNHGSPSKFENHARVWRNGLKMYESTITIMNEDVANIADDIT